MKNYGVADMRKLLLLTCMSFASPVIAESSRELEAHEHGVGRLNIAIDGTSVLIEFHAPGADIVGFEYEAKNEKDIAAIDKAIAALSRPPELFAFPATAECTLLSASAALEGEDAHDQDHHDDEEEHKDHDDHKEGDKHEGHDHDDHAEKDDHDDHAHDDHTDEDKHDAHDHDNHAKEAAGHTEFHAEYSLTCVKPDAINEISMTYFDVFENAQEVEVQIITASGAKVFEVNRKDSILDLKGVF